MPNSSSFSAVLFKDVPAKTFVGINLSSFNTSPDFVGIANIPPGLHFIYTGTDASLSIRNGRWIHFERGLNSGSNTLVLQWNASRESLELVDAQLLSTRSLQDPPKRGLVDYEALRDASAKLQADQSSQISSQNSSLDIDIDPWTQLKSHISSRLLDRILSRILTDSTDSRNRWTLTSISSAPSDTEHIPGLSQAETESMLAPSSNLDLLAIVLKQTWQDSAIGRERTEMARDRSWYFGHLIDQICAASSHGKAIDKQTGARELCGELQFCFLMVLTLANYSCLEQWKRILSVLLTCEQALGEVEGYFIEVVKILRQQLGRVDDVEGGLFEMSDEQGSAWLRRLLRRFRRNVDETIGSENSELKKVLKELEDWLKSEYGWEDESNLLRRGMIQLEDGEMVEIQMPGLDEEEETGEYAPTVVES